MSRRHRPALISGQARSIGVRVVDEASNEITVFDVAYEDTAIAAGAVPEPATMALMLVGACGVAAPPIQASHDAARLLPNTLDDWADDAVHLPV